MTRLVIALAFVVACGGKQNPPSATGSSEAPAVLAKKVVLSWGFEKHGETAEVYLATTDETGKQVSHPVGRYRGECSVIIPASAMNALTGVGCRYGGTGTELHAVVEHGAEIVVLRLGVDEGVTPDPMAREEVTRVKVPLGTKIEAGT